MPSLPIRFCTHFSLSVVSFTSAGSQELYVAHSSACGIDIWMLIVSKGRHVHFAEKKILEELLLVSQAAWSGKLQMEQGVNLPRGLGSTYTTPSPVCSLQAVFHVPWCKGCHASGPTLHPHCIMIIWIWGHRIHRILAHGLLLFAQVGHNVFL